MNSSMIRVDGKIPQSEVSTRIRVFLSLHHAGASGERTSLRLATV